jgi:hypothetical protein
MEIIPPQSTRRESLSFYWLTEKSHFQTVYFSAKIRVDKVYIRNNLNKLRKDRRCCSTYGPATSALKGIGKRF